LPARDRAREGWARLGHGGTGSPPLRGHRQNFTKALQAAGRIPKQNQLKMLAYTKTKKIHHKE